MKYEKLENQTSVDGFYSGKYDTKRCQLLFKVLCLPEFMVKFRRRLDYDKFSDMDCFMLPVLNVNQK